MTKTTIQTKAKQAVSTLLRDARDAGWSRAKFEMKPDGSVTVDAVMADAEEADDFLSGDLRISK